MLAPLSRAQADRHVAALLEEHDQSAYHFVIEIDTASPRPIGTISLQRLDRTNGSASIDVVIGDRSAWGAGYGGEAISALLDFGFDSLRLHRIWLLVYADNERAIRSYERLGFRREGIFRDGVFRHGAYHDVHEMAVLEDGWRQRRASPPIGGQ